MKQTEEFRPKNVTTAREKIPASRKNVTAARDGWQQLTDRDLRRIAIEQMDQVGVAWSIDEPHRGMSPSVSSEKIRIFELRSKGYG